jgi:hypothetical protein
MSNTLIKKVLGYYARRWALIDIPLKSKNPGRDGWQNERLTEQELRQRFAQPRNVGILLGEPSNGLTDVDLDCPEAVALARHYLPPTEAVFGHVSRPASHHLYFAPQAKTEKFEFWVSRTNKITLVELRSTGSQTVFPPSVHPSGEPIT